MTNASAELAALKPNIIKSVVPTNGAEQKQAFLSGSVRNPSHVYSGLNRPYADDVQQIIATGDAASQENAGAPVAIETAYDETIESFVDSTELMYFMQRYNDTTDDAEREQLRQKIMRLNEEFYGLPDTREYHHVLASFMRKIDANAEALSGQAKQAYYELLAGFDTVEHVSDPGAYEPRPETLAWMQKVVETLYGKMIEHVDEDSSYGPYELQTLFQEIIDEEFGPEVAAEWRVDVEPARSINVAAEQKRIVIPIDKKAVSAEKAKDLVVHELGVHMLRSVTGYDTNLPILGTGLAKYADSEEGLGVVMEQARKGKFVEAGHPLYLAASLAVIEGKDFRDVYEVMWRILLLSSDDANENEAVDTAQNRAYDVCMRIFRGTDSVPWLKDLQYYNGAAAVWQHLDTICGDDEALTLLLMGRTHVTDRSQRNAVLEAASK